ncbi:hypothetical protein J437_LFUL019304, partial [Ladona fulva]
MNAFPYCGKDDTRPSNQSLGEYVILRLTDPYKNSGINNKISLVGTMRKNRRELPPSVHLNSDVHSTRVYKNSQGHILTNYQGKKIRITMHKDVLISDTKKKKPDTILFYNRNKVGVDVMDNMCRKYSTRSATRRWPVHVFFNILDLASINSWVLSKEATDCKLSRKEYIQRLVAEMVGDSFPTEPSPSCSFQIRDTLGETAMPPKSQKRKKCQISPKCDNKSYFASSGCDLGSSGNSSDEFVVAIYADSLGMSLLRRLWGAARCTCGGMKESGEFRIDMNWSGLLSLLPLVEGITLETAFELDWVAEGEGLKLPLTNFLWIDDFHFWPGIRSLSK